MGRLRLVSADPDDKPVIEANYLQEQHDLETLVNGVKFVRELGEAMLSRLATSGSRGEEHFPGAKVASDAQIEEYVRKYAGSMYHPCCSARMGRDTDPYAVLDERLRVRGGLAALRVVDASVMPEIIGANTNATCIALGEKGADLIVQDHQDDVPAR
mmetsp:Transcript_25051/g.79703  ORF Transcript_25051/g.79703 Transcript_25051/m.79703 type:complete len:157 (+) Transcript_25051:1529-1999(+)